MASRTLNISLPVLQSGQAFRVEYREVGDTVWILWGVETANQFTVTGLTQGVCYEYQITFLESVSPLIECNAIVRTDCVPEGVPCATLDAELIQDAEGVFSLQIDIIYTPSPYAEPCDGFRLFYGELGSPQGQLTEVVIPTYAGLSLPLIVPNVPNSEYYVSIYSVGCDGVLHFCDEVFIEPLDTDCIHAEIISATLTESNGIWTVTLTVVPTTPLSGVYYVAYFQDNTTITGVPDPGGVLAFNGTGANPEVFTFTVTPNTLIIGDVLKYAGNLVDSCNFSSKWYAVD